MKLTKRQKKQLFTAMLMLIVLLLGGYTVNQPQLETVTKGEIEPGYLPVTKISDGDTILVEMNGREESIRMIGVDTPETHHPTKPVQCFGKAATEFTKRLIGQQAVRLAADPTNSNRDRYRRLLRYVYLPDGRLLNAEIIKQGYGFAYTSFPFEKSQAFKKYEKSARKNNRGLWSGCEIITNKYGGPESQPAN